MEPTVVQEKDGPSSEVVSAFVAHLTEPLRSPLDLCGGEVRITDGDNNIKIVLLKFITKIC